MLDEVLLESLSIGCLDQFNARNQLEPLLAGDFQIGLNKLFCFPLLIDRQERIERNKVYCQISRSVGVYLKSLADFHSLTNSAMFARPKNASG
jgi:hypothetical protein